MSHQDGCLSREINTNKDSGYTDIACRADTIVKMDSDLRQNDDTFMVYLINSNET